MASAAQIIANQANAQRSTGPRTAAGKANSSKNHTSHGLSSKEFVILPGQQAEFDEFMAELRQSVNPVGAIEIDLFHQLAHASWTLRRCRRAETQLQATTSYPSWDPIIVPEFEPRLHAIDLFARRAERAYHRTLHQLKALQTEREFLEDLKAAGAPAILSTRCRSSRPDEDFVNVATSSYDQTQRVIPPATIEPNAELPSYDQTQPRERRISSTGETL